MPAGWCPMNRAAVRGNGVAEDVDGRGDGRETLDAGSDPPSDVTRHLFHAIARGNLTAVGRYHGGGVRSLGDAAAQGNTVVGGVHVTMQGRGGASRSHFGCGGHD